MEYELIHLGGENCVTGSCHLLRSKGVNIVVDCGMTQGSDLQVPMEDWPVKPSEVNYLFLTHAHMDHTGRVPELIRKGFAGEIICTHPTKALLVPMLRDAMGFSREQKRTIDELIRSFDDLSWGFEYDTLFELEKGIRFKLGNAGHILGSAFIAFTSLEGGWSVTFSGDLGARNTPILPDPSIPDPCDLLVLESTYGDRLHESRENRTCRLGKMLSRALSDGGKVYIPSFALGRTQELIYEMDRIFSDETPRALFPELNKGNRVPVFIDSPLGLDITEIYSKLSSFWDKDAQGIADSGDHPIDFDKLYGIRGHRAHMDLLSMEGPAVIIAGSGMCTGGRIVNHLEKGLTVPANDVFFVGYQARGTLGREIVRYGNKPGGYVYLDGEKTGIKAKVHTLSGYSAHADQKELLQWVLDMPRRPSKIKLVHGNDDARKSLAEQFQINGCEVI